MALPLAAGVVAAALAAGTPAAPAAELARFPAGETVQALAIAGGRIFVATGRTDRSVRVLELNGKRRRTISAFGAPIPAEGHVGYELGRVAQTVRLEASASRIAVLRTVRAFWRADCFRRGCRRPGFSEPLLTELYVARPGEPLRRLIRVDHRGDSCALTPSRVVVSGAMISYVARFGESESCPRGGSIVAVVELRDRAVVHRRVFAEAREEVTALALAGPYVAWATRRPAPCPCSTVVVANWRRGTTRFRFVAPQLDDVDDIAVTPKAAVALVARVHRNGCTRTEIVLLPTRAVPRLVRAPATRIAGFDGTRLVHSGSDARTCNATRQRIAVTDVHGKTRVLRRAASPVNGLDFDGTQVVYALPLHSGRSATPQVVYRQRIR